MIFIIITLISALLITANAVNPGAEIVLTQNGLTYAKNVGVDILKQQISSIHIPDFSGSKSIFGYKISDIKITQFNLPDEQAVASILPRQGIRVKLSSASIALSGHYEAWAGSGWAKITKSGSIQLSGVVNSAQVDGHFGIQNDRPTIVAANCATNIGTINVKFIGNIFDEIVDWFSGPIGDAVKGALQPEICTLINNLLNNNANSFLQSIPVDEELPIPGTDFHINYSLVDSPVLGSDFLRLDLRGECYSASVRSPLVAPPVASYTIDPAVQIYIPITTYLVDTAGYALMKSGLMKQTLTPADVDKIVPGGGKFLDTTCPGSTCIGSVVAAIGDKYPNTTITLETDAVGSSAPNFTIDSTGVWLNGLGNIQFVTSDTQTTILNINIGLKAIITDLKFVTNADSYTLTGETHTAGASLQLINTTIPDITQTDLQNIWQLSLLALIDGQLNTLFSKGIKIPAIEYVQLYNIAFQTLPDTLLVSGNVKYVG